MALTALNSAPAVVRARLPAGRMVPDTPATVAETVERLPVFRPPKVSAHIASRKGPPARLGIDLISDSGIVSGDGLAAGGLCVDPLPLRGFRVSDEVLTEDLFKLVFNGCSGRCCIRDDDARGY